MRAFVLAMALTLGASAVSLQAQEGPGGGRGMWMGANGSMVSGTITEKAADHLTVRTEEGASYRIAINENTRIRKDRQPASASDLRVGDAVMAAGQVDEKAKTVAALFVAELSPEQVKQMQEMRASYGKTWLAGKVSAIQETKITVDGMDGKPHVIEVDENTSFRKRRESITLADVKPGDRVRAQGAAKGDAFLATTLAVMEPGLGREDVPGSGNAQPPAPSAK